MIVIRNTLEFIVRDLKRFSATVLLLTMILILFFSMVMLKIAGSYGYTEGNHVLATGINHMVKIVADDEQLQEMEADGIYDEVRDISGVRCFGTITEKELLGQSFEEYHNLQMVFGKVQMDKAYGIEVIGLNSQMFAMCNLELEEELAIDDMESFQGFTRLYLGISYYEAMSGEVGDTYTDINGDKYIVAGILKEKQKWINPNLINGFYAEDLGYSIDADQLIFEVNDEQIDSNAFWLQVDNDADVMQVIGKVRDTFSEKGISTTYTTFQEMYESSKVNNEMRMELLEKITFLVLIVSVLMILSFMVLTFWAEMKNYGILYAVGYEGTDLEKMIILKNGCCVLLAHILAKLAFTYVAKWRYRQAYIDWKIVHILMQETFVLTGLLEVGLWIGMCVIMIFYVRKHTPAEMIKCRL